VLSAAALAGVSGVSSDLGRSSVAPPSANADSPNGVTPANGNDYILPDGTVYQQNDDGTFSWIPNVVTANAMGLDWNSLRAVTILPGSVGQPFPSVLTLTNASFKRTGASSGSSAPSVEVTPANGWDYLLDNGQVYQDNRNGTCSWIPDVPTGNAMHLDWDNLIPVGDTLPCDVGYPFPHVD
jgi:hypothetical protein